MSRLPDKPGKPAKKRKLPQDRPRPGSETESLERVAELVAGGGDVDWARILGDSDGGLRAPLQNLLRLQRLAESCRSVMTPFVADRSDGSRDLDRHPPRPDEPDRATHETEAPGEIFRWGHLRARKKVGSGSFGDVYLAWDPTLEREVALKLRRDTRGVARGWNEHVDEARRLARIRHANVVAVYGVEEHEGRPGFWTEFVRGETLEERLERDGALPLAELVGIARNLASALSAVHDAGILHGDIKAANIVLEPSGRAVLMDFGAGASRAPKSEARSRRRAGTPLVMAPELWDGLSANVATDLFAFAVLLYRMASGRYPFEAKSHAGLERSIRSGEHVPIRELRPELPQELARLITKNLSVDPSSRSQGMAQMEAELRMAATSGLASSSTPVGEAFPTPSGGPTLSGTLTTFVGRARELDTLTRALLSHRFVTVMGPGGSGKTRLAEELVRRSAGLYPDGIIAIPLAAIGDPAGVLPEIGRRLGIRESRESTLESGIALRLRDLEALLLLDNCEHVIPAVRSFWQDIGNSSPRLRVLATSRTRLGVAEESTVQIRPMETPPPARAGTSDGTEILASEAVRLLVDRITSARPGFALTPSTAPAVARICRRVDGLPLALELAAARTRSLSLDVIADKLDRSYALLDRTPQAARSARDTITNSIAWSWELCSDSERALLRRVSVLPGTWSLDAAEVIASNDDLPASSLEASSLEASPLETGPSLSQESLQYTKRLDRADVPDVLAGLVDQSLILCDPDGAGPTTPDGESPLTYRILEPIREYCAAMLSESGEDAIAPARHFRWTLLLTDRAHDRMYGSEQNVWMGYLEALYENIRGALTWSKRAPDRARLGIQLAFLVRRYWLVRGHLSEGRDHFLDLIATGHLSPQDRGRALVHSASLIEALGEAERARRQTEEGLAASEAVGDEPGRSNALSMLAMLNLQLGDPATARQQFHQVLEYRRAHLDERSLPLVLNNIGVCSLTLGDWEAAVACYLESLEIALRHEDRATAAVMSINLSGTYLEAGDIENARRYAKESIPLSLAGGDKRTVARSILANADLAAYTGDLVRARTLAREALDYRMGDDDWRHGALAAAILLQIETVADRPEEAAETLGLLERHVGMTELGYLPGRKAMRARVAKDLKKTLGEATFEAAHRRGSLSGIQVLIQRLGDASLDRSSPIPEA